MRSDKVEFSADACADFGAVYHVIVLSEWTSRMDMRFLDVAI